jgi:hypothetical protein
MTLPWALLEAPGTTLVSLQPFQAQVETEGDQEGVARQLAALGAATATWPLGDSTAAAAAIPTDWRQAFAAAKVAPVGPGRVSFTLGGATLDPLLLWPLVR